MVHAASHFIADQRFLIWPIVGIVTGAHGFVQGFRLLRRKRLILNTPASKIRSAAMGLVEVSGLATGPHVVTSPLKQTECYYYRSIAWKLEPRGKQSEWVKVADESLHVPFYIDDSTGKLLIDPTGAEMDVHCDFQEEYQESMFVGGDVPPQVSGFLARHGAAPSGKIKVEEYCIKPESFLFVLGTLSQNPGLDATLTPVWATRAGAGLKLTTQMIADAEPLQQVIRLSAGAAPVPVSQMTQQQKIAAALAKAGTLVAMPWNSGDLKLQAQTPKEMQSVVAVEETRVPFDSTGFDLHPPVVLMKGSNEPTFLISWRSQRDVVNSLDWKSKLMVWGSPVLVLGCVYVLIMHLR